MNLIKMIVMFCFFVLVVVLVLVQLVINDILNDGVFKVGIMGDWNLMMMKDVVNNIYIGYDIDVMIELVKDFNVEVEFVLIDWKILVSGVIVGKYYIIGLVFVFLVWVKVVGYLIFYFLFVIVLFIFEVNVDKFKDWVDFNNGDVIVVVIFGIIQEKQVKDFFLDVKYQIVEVFVWDF